MIQFLNNAIMTIKKQIGNRGDDYMKCPYCGREMEQGVIQSTYELNWQKKRRLMNRSDMYEDAICLSPMSFWKGSAVTAWLCRDCNKIVIDYSPKPDEPQG